jgi:hypothetical protein
MKKRSLVIIGVAIIICFFGAVAFANNQVKIIVNGQEVNSDVAPQIVKDRTMVPVRWVAEALGADVRWEPQSKTVYIDKPHFISSNSEAASKLYPFQESNGMYDGFVLEINGKRQYFDWQNVKNPSFGPQMILNDINQDGEKELIVILTTGTGTGYHTEDIHVLNPANFKEIKVEQAADIAKEKLDTKIEDDGDNKAIHIITADEKTTVHKERDYSSSWFDKVVFKNFYHYSVINDKLLLTMGAQVSPAGFIGEIEVKYEFENGEFGAGTVRFKQEDENEKAIAELIRDFGSKLKHVSLLAPEKIVKDSIQENYGEYVSPALLAQWKNDLQNVPGRVASSPWPERIDIVDTNKLSDYRYRIEADIIKMTSVEMAKGGEAGRRSITLEVEKIENQWLIVKYENNESPVYKNGEYGFSFTLPETWRDYSIISSQWEGVDPESGITEAHGPIISIRHPQWTDKNPRQDIPIMVFTQAQWKQLQQRELSVGAAPIPPKELGRNDSYVFALPARYNYAFPTGYEEVERILDSNPLTAI